MLIKFATTLCLIITIVACNGGGGVDSGQASVTPNANNNQPLVTACVASGTTRLEAQTAYRNSCEVAMQICTPMPDQWMCASDTRSVTQYEDSGSTDALQNLLRSLLVAQTGGEGLSAFTLPIQTELSQIPQDPNNPLTPAKVRLGQFLFHDTGFSLNGVSGESRSWSCSTCHNAMAGFKAGVPQGIAEGGVAYGLDGSARQLALGFDAHANEDADNKPDLQPVTPPATLNVAYQQVVLWNGELGNNGIVNSTVAEAQLSTVGTPREANARGFAGPETQAIAGIKLHRLKMDGETPLVTNAEYRTLWADAYPGGSTDIREDAGKAVASFVRTMISNQAPFQRWLRGDPAAMNHAELRGAILFFGDAGCASCHQGPALSSHANAAENEIFSAVGFADFDTAQINIHGDVPAAARLGRGGFTQVAADNYKFKVPQLYNLADSPVLGHGASFSTVRDVVKYKNAAIPQNEAAADNLDHRFVPLGLSISDISYLTVFLTTALHDPDLARYEPAYVPSGECITVNPADGSNDYRCNYTTP